MRLTHDPATCHTVVPARPYTATCKNCGEAGLSWHRCAVIASQWRLYKTVNGTADTTSPHLCRAGSRPRPRPSFDTLPAPTAPAPAPAPTAEAQPIVAEPAKVDIDAIVLQVLSMIPEPKVDVQAIISQVKVALNTPLTIEIKKDGETLTTIDGAHCQVPELLYWASTRDGQGHRFPVLLFGKPGVSKSHSTRQVADALGLSFGLISLNPQTPESRLFGFYHANGGYITTAFRQAFEHGGVFLIDEIDNASDALLTSLNSCLANGHGAFPDGLVKRHPDFVCVATANTAGRGGDANHAGRRPLDAATINRFACIEWLNDDALEARLAEQANAKTGQIWLGWIRKVRQYCEINHPKVVVSPRSTMMGARAILDSPFSLSKIADMTLFKGLDKDTRMKILAACPLPHVPGRS